MKEDEYKEPEVQYGIELNEDTERAWRGYLKDFESEIYRPFMHQYGMTFGEAFLSWQMNRVLNAIYDVEKRLAENDSI